MSGKYFVCIWTVQLSIVLMLTETDCGVNVINSEIRAALPVLFS